MRHLQVWPILLAMWTFTLAAQADAKDFAFVYVDGSGINLPSCPEGCRVLGCRKFSVFMGAKSAKHLKQKGTWTTFFHYMGLEFPKGGFVVYDPATDICFVANIPGELEALWYECGGLSSRAAPPNHALQRTASGRYAPGGSR